MASPVADTYSVASGAGVYGGLNAPDALPAWRPAPGNIADISLNVLEDVNPCPSNACAWSGTTNGPREIFRVWCGGVFARDLGSLGSFLIFGGGHLSYDGNEVYRYDLASRLWSVCGTPAPYNGAQIEADGEYPDGTPPPPHTYGMTGYLPASHGGGTLGDFLCFGLPGGNVEQRVHAMDLATGVWRRFTASDLAFGYGGGYGSVVWDEARSGWWVVPAKTNYCYFVSSTGVVTAQHTNTNRDSAAESMTCYLPSRDILVNFDWAGGNVPKFAWLDCSLAAPEWQPITITGTPPSWYAWGFEYVDSIDTIVSYEGTGQESLYRCAIPSDLADPWAWTTESFSGTASYVSSNPNGHWRRLVYAPIAECLIWVESGTGPVQALTLGDM